MKAMFTGILAGACAVMALAGPARAAGAQPQPYVVIVGISNYADKQIKPRPHAEDDAKALYDLFTDKDAFGVDADHARLLLGTDDAKRGSQSATRENILNALKWVAKEAGPDDLVIFAFFGEGGPLGDTGDRRCYFAADSTFKGRDKDAVAAGEIAEALKNLKSQHFAVFLDVDFKGFTGAGRQAVPSRRSPRRRTRSSSATTAPRSQDRHARPRRLPGHQRPDRRRSTSRTTASSPRRCSTASRARPTRTATSRTASSPSMS